MNTELRHVRNHKRTRALVGHMLRKPAWGVHLLYDRYGVGAPSGSMVSVVLPKLLFFDSHLKSCSFKLLEGDLFQNPSQRALVLREDGRYKLLKLLGSLPGNLLRVLRESVKVVDVLPT